MDADIVAPVDAPAAAPEIDHREALLSKSLDEIVAERQKAAGQAKKAGGAAAAPAAARRKSGGAMRGKEKPAAAAASRGPLGAPKPSAMAAVSRTSLDCRVYVGNVPFDADWKALKDWFAAAGHPCKVDIATTLRDGAVRSKGYAIAAFATPNQATAAVAALNDAEFTGRRLHLREDREEVVVPPPRPAGGFGAPAPHHHHHQQPPQQQVVFAGVPAYGGAPAYGGYAPQPQHHAGGARPVVVSSRITVEKAAPGGGDAAAHAGCHSVLVAGIPADINREEFASIFAEVGRPVHVGLQRSRAGEPVTGWLHFGSAREQARAIAEYNAARVNDHVITVTADTHRPGGDAHHGAAAGGGLFSRRR